MIDTIEVGYQVFAEDGGEEFGAVRAVHRGHNPDITVYVENAGDFVIPGAAVKAVHEKKVILDVLALDPKLRQAIGHAHENED